MKLKKLIGVLAVVIFGLAACQNKTGQQTSETTKTTKLSVVTSFYPVYYMTKEIAGEHADVKQLISGNVEPHDYEPSAKNIADIDNANVFIYSSEHMETWVKKVENGLGTNKKVTFVAAGKDVEFAKTDDHDHDHVKESDHDHEHSVDPHIWLDPVLAKTQVETIAQALIAADPTHKADYEKNKQQLLAKLDTIIAEYDTLKNAKQKKFVVQHEAFGYIARRYGLEQIAITGLQNQEPSAQVIADVIKKINEHQLRTIYVEATQSNAIAQVVSNQTGIAIERLYTMEIETAGKDYLELLRENIQALKKTIN